jgi:hypothetical protein
MPPMIELRGTVAAAVKLNAGAAAAACAELAAATAAEILPAAAATLEGGPTATTAAHGRCTATAVAAATGRGAATSGPVLLCLGRRDCRGRHQKRDGASRQQCSFHCIPHFRFFNSPLCAVVCAQSGSL